MRLLMAPRSAADELNVELIAAGDLRDVAIELGLVGRRKSVSALMSDRVDRRTGGSR